MITPVMALIKDFDNDSDESSFSFTIDGKEAYDYDCNTDLFFASEKREVWINIYKYDGRFIVDERTRNTKEEALNNKDTTMNYVGTFKLEFEEE